MTLFPHSDPYWRDALAFAKRQISVTACICAPNEFRGFFPKAHVLESMAHIDPLEFDWVIFHKDFVRTLPVEYLLRIRDYFVARYANAVFVVLSRLPSTITALPHFARNSLTSVVNGYNRRRNQVDVSHVTPLWELIETRIRTSHQISQGRTAIVVSTYNRPWALARSLDSLISLKTPILVVNDGSEHRYQSEYETICVRHQSNDVRWIAFPDNRGLAAALNSGVAYWLADTGVIWISAFEDDVEVHPDTLITLARIQDPQKRPLLTGYNASEHPIIAHITIAGLSVKLRTATAGAHLHAHRDYWASVLPIPTRELGAPRPGYAGDIDWWVGTWSPNSITRRGGYIACVDDLVTTFAVLPEQSTWNNPYRR